MKRLIPNNLSGVKDMKIFFYIGVPLLLLSIFCMDSCSAARMIKDIPCEEIVSVNYNKDSDGNTIPTRYKIYYFENKNKKNDNCLMIVAQVFDSLTIKYKSDTEDMGGPYYSMPGGYAKTPDVAAERILAHHIKLGDIKRDFDYVWFASSYTDRFPNENELRVSGVRLYILRMNNMFSSYNNGRLQIWEGDPNA